MTQFSGEDKRMPNFLNHGEYGPWLACGHVEAPKIFKQHPGSFLGESAPLARAPKLAKEPRAKDELLPPVPPKKVKEPPPPSPQGDLF